MCELDEIEYAEVVWFNVQKRYGFAKRSSNDEQIFFHLGDGKSVVIRNSNFTFDKPLFTRESSSTISIPEKGDMIVFKIAKGKRNMPKASPWCYQGMIDNAWDQYDRENEVCSCGHLMGDHTGGICMMDHCHCGDPAYEELYESLREIPNSDSPGGFTFCQ